MNYADMLESIADAFPDDIVVSQGDKRITWRLFDERSARLSQAFKKLGAGKDDMVAFFIYNCTEYLEGIFATFKLRSIPINVNFRYIEDELKYLLEDSGAKILLFHGSLSKVVSNVRDQVSTLKAVVQLDDGSPLLEGAFRYEDLIAENEPAERIKRSIDDLYILYTGGTTGMPKGVVWDHRGLFGTQDAIYSLTGVAPPKTIEEVPVQAKKVREAGFRLVCLPSPPLIHGTAYLLATVTLVLGGSVEFLRSKSLDADELWRTVQERKVTQIIIIGDAFGKPMIKALEEAEEKGEPYDLSSVTQIFSSGVMWTAPVKQKLAEYGDMYLIDTIGSSEGGPFGSSTVGPGMPATTATFKIGNRAKILREDGTEIPPGSDETGMLAVYGPIPLRYHNAPEKSAETFRTIDGVRYSIPGDYAKIDADGTITLLGRGSICINSAGEKIYPEEVESAIKQHPAVEDCNVIGLPDEEWGSVVTAVVQLQKGNNSTTYEDIIESLGDKISRYKHPKHIVFVEKIKRTPAGKSIYKLSREIAAEKLGISIT